MPKFEACRESLVLLVLLDSSQTKQVGKEKDCVKDPPTLDHTHHCQFPEPLQWEQLQLHVPDGVGSALLHPRKDRSGQYLWVPGLLQLYRAENYEYDSLSWENMSP